MSLQNAADWISKLNLRSLILRVVTIKKCSVQNRM